MKKWFVLDQALSGLSSDLYVLETEGEVIVSSTPLGARFKRVEAIPVLTRTDFQARNAGIVDASRLQETNILVIGLGSGGSKTATSLLRSGCTWLTLVDFDPVEVSNLCRSEYEFYDVGDPKTEALRRRLLRINPLARIDIVTRNIHEMSRRELEDLVGRHSLVFECTDDPKTKLKVNAVAYHRVPVVYPALYDGGKGGEVLYTLPGITPCYQCIMGSVLPQMTEIKRGDWDYTTDSLKPMAGLNSHIDVVVARSVDIALGILLAGTELDRTDKVLVPGCSLLFIGNEGGFFIFDKPFQEIWAKTEFDTDCICRTEPQSAPDEVTDEPTQAEAVPERPEDSGAGEIRPAHDEANREETLPQPEESGGEAVATGGGGTPETVS